MSCCLNSDHRHTVFLKFPNFNDAKNQEGQSAPDCEISWRWVKPLPRYGDFSIFQNGDRRHLGFLTFQNFNSQKDQNASDYQVFWRSVKPLRRYGDFNIFVDNNNNRNKWFFFLS